MNFQVKWTSDLINSAPSLTDDTVISSDPASARNI